MGNGVCLTKTVGRIAVSAKDFCLRQLNITLSRRPLRRFRLGEHFLVPRENGWKCCAILEKY
jgi:hypothetical protein